MLENFLVSRSHLFYYNLAYYLYTFIFNKIWCNVMPVLTGFVFIYSFVGLPKAYFEYTRSIAYCLAMWMIQSNIISALSLEELSLVRYTRYYIQNSKLWLSMTMVMEFKKGKIIWNNKIGNISWERWKEIGQLMR